MTRQAFGREDFLGFLFYYNSNVDIDIIPIEEDEYEDVAMLLVNENNAIEDIMGKLFSYERVIFMNMFLLQNDFIRTATELAPEMKKEMLKTDDLSFSIDFEDTIYVISLNKVKVKRNKKTEIEYKVELEDALKDEDYKKAAIIRDKLNKKSKSRSSPKSKKRV